MADTLTNFFNCVGKNGLLTREGEVILAKAILDGDKRARDKMITSNLRLAISIAKRYMNKGCSFEDLIQESNVGLIKAVDRFDHTRGFKFSTYATWWIKQSVRRHVTDQSCSIRMPASANAFYYRAKMMIQDYTTEFKIAPNDNEVAEFMGVSLGKYMTLMNTYRGTISLDAPASSGDSEGPRLHETIADDAGVDAVATLDHAKIVAIIHQVLAKLTPREEKVIRLRFGISESDFDSKKYPITEDELATLNIRAGGV